MNIDALFAGVVIKLLKGPLYDEDPDWSNLMVVQRKVRDYLGEIGLELNLFEEEGFAYLSQMEGEGYDGLPRLVTRRRISFEATLLCVILREELERFDRSGSESYKLHIEKAELRERIRIYFKEKTDETRLFRELDNYINQVENLGFIKKVGPRGEGDDVYEVRRILKAKVDPAFLADFKQRLEVYVNALC